MAMLCHQLTQNRNHWKMKLRRRQAHGWWKFGIIFLIFVAGYFFLEAGWRTPEPVRSFEELHPQVLPILKEPVALPLDYGRTGCGGRHLLQVVSSNKSGIYPPDVFSLEQKKNGAVVIHIVGMIYMFVALAIVCDEFFVPALGVIIENLDVSDDVAGATFMAAGGSAPELSTSIIGVFLANSDVGIGTIVGSAVFNVLFVIGMCAVFSKTVLHLTWWPLFRDCMFYCASILVLIAAFYNYRIEWYESICLLAMYGLYVTFMKYNMQIESWVKSRLQKNNRIANGREISRQRRVSISQFRNTSMYRQGALQLLLHTLDPLRENQSSDERIAESTENVNRPPQGDAAANPPAPAPVNPQKVISGSTSANNLIIHAKGEMIIGVNGVTASSSTNGNLYIGATGDMAITVSGGNLESSAATAKDSTGSSDERVSRAAANSKEELPRRQEPRVQFANGNGVTIEENALAVPGGQNGKRLEDLEGVGRTISEPGSLPDDIQEEPEEPLDLAFPKGLRKRITYILLMPLILPLYLTLPDVRRLEKRKWFPVTFLGSILWIAAFSYLMVWWAVEVAETLDIHEPVMGLTFLAAGTSIPDLITSVIVARKGLGDMAVSSSVGSNIFDITIGLPFPWLLWSLINSLEPVTVESKGLFCSIILLFLMLMFVIITIAVCRWRMTRALGMAMFFMYGVFLTLSLLLEADIITCITLGAAV